MKEFSVILAAALFVGIFSSCSSKSKDTPTPPPAPTPPTLKEYLHTKHVIHINSSGKKAGGRIYTYDVHGRLVEEGSEFVINFEENLVKTRYSHSDYNEDGTLRSLKEYTSPDTGVSYALTYQIKYHYEKVNGKPQLVREEKYVPDGSAEATKLVSRKEYTWENGRKAKIVDYSTYNEQTKQLSETSTIKYRYVGAKEIAELYPTGVTTATQIEESQYDAHNQRTEYTLTKKVPSPDPRDPRNKTIYLVREQIKTTTTYDKAGNIIKEVRTGSSYATQIDITTEYIYSKPDKQGNPTLLEEKATGTGGYVRVYRIDNTYAKG